MDRPPTKQLYDKGLSNFWFDLQKNIIYFREGEKEARSSQITLKDGKYEYGTIISSNIYDIIARSSLYSTIFSGPDQHVALTEEALKLPLEDQPWFIGAVTEKGDLKDFEKGNPNMLLLRSNFISKLPNAYFILNTT